jgi:hypothetical protein
MPSLHVGRKYYLLKYFDNYENLFVCGFTTFSQYEYEKWRASFNIKFPNYTLDLSAHHFITYKDEEEFMARITIEQITAHAYSKFRRYFGQTYGSFPL